MGSNADLSAKLTKINDSMASNSSLLAEIKKYQALKRTDADGVIADSFTLCLRFPCKAYWLRLGFQLKNQQFPQVGT
jgi:hypothetical protein